MEITFKQIVADLLRKWYVLVIALVLGVGAGYFVHAKTTTTKYQTQALMEVTSTVESTSTSSATTVAQDLNKLNYEHALIPTILQAIENQKNIENVYQKTKLYYADLNAQRVEEGKAKLEIPSYLSRGYVDSAVVSAGGGQTQTLLITITATANDPNLAVAMINAYMDCASEVTEGLGHNIALEIEDDQRPSFATMDTDIKVLTTSPVKYVFVFAICAFLVAAIVIVLLAANDNSIHSEKDIQTNYDLPVLAVIPVTTDKSEDDYDD